MADSTPWWKSSTPESQMAATIEALDNEQSHRSEMNQRHLRFYSNRMSMGLSGSDWSIFDTGDRLKLNIVKAVINTATAWIATGKVRSMFKTSAGNRAEKRMGMDLGRFIVGQRMHMGLHEALLEIFRDAGIFGDGICKIYPKFQYLRDGTPVDGEICCDRVLSNDLIVDDVECRHGRPQSIIQFAEVDPDVIIDQFNLRGMKAANVKSSELVRPNFYTHERTQVHPVGLMEGYRLGGPDNPGRRVVCTSNQVIIDEPWEPVRYPFAKFSWDTPVLGYFGIGISEELAPVQREINYILQKVQKLMTLATSQVWIEKGSEINSANLTNEDFAAREFKGRPPIFMTVAAVSPEYFNQLDRLWDRGFETIGVNQMSATGEKPAGLNSGVAVRNYRDVTTRRFLHTQQRWEKWNVEVDDRLVECARMISEAQGSFKVNAVDRRGLETLDFKDINLARDKYVLQVHPVSFLPDEPAGQMQTLKEFGEISPEIQKMLLSELTYPDLESAVRRANAPQRLVELIIERMLDDGDYRPPDPFIDPSISVPMVRTAIMEAEVDGVPEDRVQLLRNFVLETQKLWAPPPAPPMPAGPQPGAQPQLPTAGPAAPSPAAGPAPVEQPPGPAIQ